MNLEACCHARAPQPLWRQVTPSPHGLQFQELTKQLVASGQLEFINGGACMHDEANPTYVDMIDQTSVGHRFLKQTFNVTPKATWQIGTRLAVFYSQPPAVVFI